MSIIFIINRVSSQIAKERNTDNRDKIIFATSSLIIW